MNMVWHPVELYVENLDLIIDVTGVQISVYSKEKKNVEKETQEHLFWVSNISGASEIPTIIISNFVISKAEYHYT